MVNISSFYIRVNSYKKPISSFPIVWAQLIYRLGGSTLQLVSSMSRFSYGRWELFKDFRKGEISKENKEYNKLEGHFLGVVDLKFNTA
jgi:hypothetical protein